MSDLENSIGRICVILALNPSMHDSLRKALHAFAAAIQGEKGRCCDNGRMGDAHVCQKQPGAPQMTIEEAAKITLGHIPKCPKCAVSYPSDLHLEKCSWKQPTPELPPEVREKIKEVMEGTFIYGESLSKIDRGLRYGSGFGRMLEDLCHLCLSMRAK